MKKETKGKQKRGAHARVRTAEGKKRAFLKEAKKVVKLKAA